MTHTTKHTQGPLKAVQVIIENSPCTWAVQRKSIREQWGKPSIATYIDNEADARLFAAAPAMYEALVEFLQCGPNAGHNQDLITMVQTAIAQAEGQQP
jgi:spore coat polysaccharide biosynthesis protein SpsF (cytidylyltransferase family)